MNVDIFAIVEAFFFSAASFFTCRQHSFLVLTSKKYGRNSLGTQKNIFMGNVIKLL